jgi:hypothetical protein
VLPQTFPFAVFLDPLGDRDLRGQRRNGVVVFSKRAPPSRDLNTVKAVFGNFSRLRDELGSI